MKRLLLVMVLGLLPFASTACSEQKEKIMDLFHWGETRPKHEVKKTDPKVGEDLDMSKMTLESLKKAGVKMTEIPADTVIVSPERQQITGVRYGRVEYRNMEKKIRTVGRLEFDEKKISTVNPKIGGWIEELYVDYTGKMVRKGQPLLSIYSPELVSTQQELLLALKAKEVLSKSGIFLPSRSRFWKIRAKSRRHWFSTLQAMVLCWKRWPSKGCPSCQGRRCSKSATSPRFG
jgi:hypothetical protein